MRRRVVWSDPGRDNYLATLRYVAQQNSKVAARIADRIGRAVRNLSEFATSRTGRVSDIYEKVVAGLPYVVAYRIVEQPDGGETVAILHVIHVARDWPPETWPAA